MARPTSGPSGPTLSTPRLATNPWIILIVLALGFFMILLDTTIVNVAIPSFVVSMTLGAVVTLLFMHSQKDAQDAARSSGGMAVASE